MLTGGKTGAAVIAFVRAMGLALGCLAANLACAIGYATAASCVLKRTGSADINIVNDRVLVPVTLNGHRATLVLATADAVTVISSAYVRLFGLKQDHHRVVEPWVSADWAREMVIAPDLMTIGSQRYRGVRVIAAPDESSASADTAPVIGRLGMGLLGMEDFEIDFANKKLNFYSSDHCPGAVVYWTDRYAWVRIVPGNHVLYFPMELEGRTILAVLSTGTPMTSLFTDVTRKLFGFDESSAGIETETEGSGHVPSHYRTMTLTGRGMTFANARVRLVPVPTSVGRDANAGCDLIVEGTVGVAYYERCTDRAPLTLGLNVLRHLHLYFAMRERFLYFSEATATK